MERGATAEAIRRGQKLVGHIQSLGNTLALSDACNNAGRDRTGRLADAISPGRVAKCVSQSASHDGARPIGFSNGCATLHPSPQGEGGERKRAGWGQCPNTLALILRSRKSTCGVRSEIPLITPPRRLRRRPSPEGEGWEIGATAEAMRRRQSSFGHARSLGTRSVFRTHSATQARLST